MGIMGMGINEMLDSWKTVELYVKQHVGSGASRGAWGSFSPPPLNEVGHPGKRQKQRDGSSSAADMSSGADTNSGAASSFGAGSDIHARFGAETMPGAPQAPAAGRTAPADDKNKAGKAAAMLQEFSPGQSRARLQEAIVWSEILGEPVSKKRRRKRVKQQCQ